MLRQRISKFSVCIYRSDSKNSQNKNQNHVKTSKIKATILLIGTVFIQHQASLAQLPECNCYSPTGVSLLPNHSYELTGPFHLVR